mgnify:CR=1 FL=1
MKRNKKILLSPPHIGVNELKFVNKAFETNWIAPVGPNLSLFEQKISEISLNYHVAALSSGTAAIHLALILLGIKKDDEVLCSSFTFAASVNPVKYLMANPIFIDSEKESWNMCPELLEKAIKDRLKKNKKPKAIILVHLYGMPANMEKIMNISRIYNIPVIEDAAESLGSKYLGKPLGTFGEFGIFSFNGNKIITTSGGGALISKNESLIEKSKYLATQARNKKPYYEHLDIGYNYRLSNVSAGIGLGQLEVLNKRVLAKRAINIFYRKSLSSISGISFIDESEQNYSNFWLSTMILDKKKTIGAENLRLYLEKNNIESRRLWRPMHLQPVFSDCISYVNGVSEELFDKGLCLPSGTAMSEEDLQFIVDKIKNAI